jgi:ATP-dependent Clp protease ATP-binding subunit ClpC
MFSPLSLEEMEQIVILQMKEVQDRLNDYNITIELTDAARRWLAKEGYDPAFGARPLRRAIQKNVESPLSLELLGGKFKDGATVQVDVDEEKNRIVFHTSQAVKRKTKQHADA